jgi:hypothetical protein
MSEKLLSVLVSLVLLACGLSFYPMEKDRQWERQVQQKSRPAHAALPPQDNPGQARRSNLRQ